LSFVHKLLKTSTENSNARWVPCCVLAAIRCLRMIIVGAAEIDQSTESVKVTIDATAVLMDAARHVLEGLCGAMHSMDDVAAAKRQ